MWTAVLRPCLVSLALLLAGIAVGCAPGAIDGADQPQQVDDGSGAPRPDDSDGPSVDDGLDDDLFVDSFTLFDRQADMFLTITDDADFAISVSIRQTVVIGVANGRTLVGSLQIEWRS